MAFHGVTYVSLNMQKGFMRLRVTGTFLDNDCCVKTHGKNCPPSMYKFSKTLRVNLKILGTRKGDKNRFSAESQQVLDCSVHSLVAMVTWRPGFMHPCCHLNVWQYICVQSCFLKCIHSDVDCFYDGCVESLRTKSCHQFFYMKYMDTFSFEKGTC